MHCWSSSQIAAMTASQRAALRVARLRISQGEMRLTVGDTVQLAAVALDVDGKPVEGVRVLFHLVGRLGVLVGADRLAAIKPGRADLRAFVVKPAPPGTRPVLIADTADIVVVDLPVTLIEIISPPGILYAGTSLGYTARALVRDGRAWVKITGPTRISAQLAPEHADVRPLAEALVEVAPSRLVWGSDWPHVALWSRMPDDGDLVDDLARWGLDEAMRRRALVENPLRLYGP